MAKMLDQCMGLLALLTRGSYLNHMASISLTKVLIDYRYLWTSRRSKPPVRPGCERHEFLAMGAAHRNIGQPTTLATRMGEGYKFRVD